MTPDKTPVAKPVKDKPVKPAAKGKYMILRADGTTAYWAELGWFDGPEPNARRAAIMATPDLREAIERGDEIPLVAVAARSWKPRAPSSTPREPILKV